MIDALSFNSANSQMISLLENLNKASWIELTTSEFGHIFTDEYLASDWNTIDVLPERLPEGVAQKGMRKITTPVLLLKSHNSRMAFILATKDNPVYVSSGFKRSKTDGFTMLFKLKPHVYSEYLFYMSKYKTWTSISHSIDSSERYGLGIGFKMVGQCDFLEDKESITYAEDVFLNACREEVINIPMLSTQRQQIDEAKMMEQVILDKLSEKERKFQQKEWLNEAHIRNSKHRLSNDLFPVRMAVERLEKFITNSSDGVKLSSTIGKVTNQSVADLLCNLIKSIDILKEDIERLTESETAGNQVEIIEVETFIKEYCNRVASKYNRSFSVNIDVRDKDLKIRISHNSLETIIDNIFANAAHHGFTDYSREDYKICITLSETSEGNCRIDIANNGNPFTERGRDEFFVRGSFSGITGNTGLGGALIYKICEEFNGKAIAPYSTVDFPVVVSVEFPIVLL